MTADQIIDGILDREKQGTPPYLSTHDAGGRTSWGISERAHPEEWRPGPPSRARARVVYQTQYVKPFDFVPRSHEALRVAMIDDGVMSGGVIPEKNGSLMAIKRLQAVLRVPIDGWAGPVTLAAIAAIDPRLLLTRYVVERAIRITRLVQYRPADLVNLTGWITRILGFLP